MVKRKAEDSDYEADIVETTMPRRSLRPRATRNVATPLPMQQNTANISYITLHLFPRYDRRLRERAKVVRKPRRRRTTPATNKYGFDFGHDPLENHPSPTQEDIEVVAGILKAERPVLKVVADENGSSSNPFHAGGGISLDSIVRVIMSQASTNEGALDGQQTMIRAYPYMVDGKAVVGKMPNYHAMRKESMEKLCAVLKRTGLQNTKAERIKDVLDVVYKTNVARIQPGEVIYDGNEPGATDFVPGLLSVEYIYEAYQQGGKQAVFDQLVLLPQVGVKSACCLMGFNMNLPVFAVDTHVAGMAKLLG